MNSRYSLRFLLLLGFSAILTIQALGQTANDKTLLKGKVFDPNHAAIQGADVWISKAGLPSSTAVTDRNGEFSVALMPGQYQVRLKTGNVKLTQPFKVLIDPRVAADGVTLADLQEQFEHNMRMRELVSSVNQLVTRVREAQKKDANTAARVSVLAAKLLTEPVRYGKPGLQAHVNYLLSMTANVDQKIGRDAIERYQQLKKEFDALQAELNRILAAPVSTIGGPP